MRSSLPLIGLLAVMLAPPSAVLAQEEEPEFTDEFPLEDCHFKTRGGNPYFILQTATASFT